jgi:3-oxoacyl-[acyl-carrier protein] reductase
MDLGLKGLNVIITGGSKGIGRHAADVFAEEGANVSICARKAAEVNDAVNSLKAKKVKAIGTALDVSDKAPLEAWVADSAKQLGGIDIVIANVSALAVEDNEEAWRK